MGPPLDRGGRPVASGGTGIGPDIRLQWGHRSIAVEGSYQGRDRRAC